jgi:soluble lytic murein transglycosylase-like protein
MILSERGDVLASCPLDPESNAIAGIWYLDIPSLPAGKYYIKLIADYAVVDTRQIVKLP